MNYLTFRIHMLSHSLAESAIVSHDKNCFRTNGLEQQNEAFWRRKLQTENNFRTGKFTEFCKKSKRTANWIVFHNFQQIFHIFSLTSLWFLNVCTELRSVRSVISTTILDTFSFYCFSFFVALSLSLRLHEITWIHTKIAITLKW